ncbi:hypothetical protein GCM10022377_10060 [Zhihengliuella alba]|uniref:DUF4239 domain-containing protein n=1 Tax=Zhihengliuella alba TaxID=547018 RepID=A0ABP7D6K8_9MICC
MPITSQFASNSSSEKSTGEGASDEKELSPAQAGNERRTRLALFAGAFLIVLGLVILSFALVRFITERRGIGLVVPGCSLVAAGVASLVATMGIASWSEQRERDRQAKEYEHREKVYESIAEFMIARFVGKGYDASADGQLRARAALWGSPAVVDELAEWQQALTVVLERSRVFSVDDSGNPTRVMSPQDSALAKRRLGSALAAMRRDLASETSLEVDKVSILRSIFNEDIPASLYEEEA